MAYLKMLIKFFFSNKYKLYSLATYFSSAPQYLSSNDSLHEQSSVVIEKCFFVVFVGLLVYEEKEDVLDGVFGEVGETVNGVEWGSFFMGHFLVEMGLIELIYNSILVEFNLFLVLFVVSLVFVVVDG